MLFKDIPQWPNDNKNLEFLERTPANGDAYYDADNDTAIVIYKSKTIIHSDRIKNREGKTASCFTNHNTL